MGRSDELESFECRNVVTVVPLVVLMSCKGVEANGTNEALQDLKTKSKGPERRGKYDTSHYISVVIGTNHD